MPYVLRLPARLRTAGWKVKVHDLERLEEPHVTIYRKRKCWRLKLRDGEFLDEGKWSSIDQAVRAAIQANWEILAAEWDAPHPENPVESTDDE